MIDAADQERKREFLAMCQQVRTNFEDPRQELGGKCVIGGQHVWDEIHIIRRDESGKFRPTSVIDFSSIPLFSGITIQR